VFKIKKLRHHVFTENVPLSKMYLIKHLRHHVLTENVPLSKTHVFTENVPLSKMYLIMQKFTTPCINRKCTLIKNVFNKKLQHQVLTKNVGTLIKNTFNNIKNFDTMY